MPKFKIAVGICGPQILYDTCTGATKEEAVRKLIDDMREREHASWEAEQELKKLQNEFLDEKYVLEEFVPKSDSYWEDLYEEYLRNAKIVVRVKKSRTTPIEDYLGQVIHLNDPVVFIRNKRGNPTKLMQGNIEKITGNGVIVRALDGEEYKIMLSTSSYLDNTKLLKVIVLNDRAIRTGELKDVTGYPVCVDDKIAYMGDVVDGASRTFELATVKRLSGRTVFFDIPIQEYLGGGTKESKRSLDRLVVL